ncbi:Flagellar hook-length control protein FliK [Paramagnetospirillum magnetotacticum MS-1]|uniref:Flagellar hook-length control protein FliK n=1 Tax=Paramagnetospirillum magnetotacticum MS-1 TaxID=272627 RepID=A0A0C2UDT2_PARME|nr:flagellar hook-length control protein FliK [Paramagnetospirillum magnetotacticum]KIL99632.1 Flagellar hook-length control protein FliK [Paramagnetospirillum magnetotacticum MS-1]
MTVQSIDKRVVPEANMTPVSQDKAQAGVSAEDAFLSVLQQTTQRFAGKNGSLGGLASGDKVLSEHITHLHTEVKIDAKDARKDAQGDAKDARPALKADKPRAAGGNTAKARKDDDAQAAPAPAQNDDDSTPAVQIAAADTSDKSNAAKDDQTVQAPEAIKAQDDQQIIIAVDVTIKETVEIVQVDPGSANAPTQDPNALVQDVKAQLTGADDTKDQQKDPMAGLSADDRKRVSDLENRLVKDVQNGDMDDALDAATELVSQLVAKVGQHKAAAQANADDLKDSLADEQARDLAELLAGSNVHLDIKVQTTTVETTPTTQTTSTVLETLSLQDLAAQAANAQGNSQDQQQGQGFGSGQQEAGAALVEQPSATPTQETGSPAAAEPEASPFAAILAAQVEASVTDETVPEQRNVIGLAGVGGAQAADKASAGQAAQTAARTPRTLVQAQVMEQVTVQIDKQVKDGADTIKIQLKPYDLGKIEIKLEVSADGHVTATVSADKPETLAMLQKDAKGLEKALEDAGLKPDSTATTFSLKGGEQQQNADRNHNNTRSRRGRGRGAANGEDGQMAATAGAAQAARGRTLGGRSGVDISV